jgi:prophage tail gpP-like protein
MTDLFELKIMGSKYEGWTSVSLRRSIQELAHSFSVSLTDRWSADQEKIPIYAGDEYVLSLNGKDVSVGYIDNSMHSYSATSEEISFNGRSKTGDLIDCAAIHKSGHWKNQGLLKIAKDICSPFSINVNSKIDLGGVFNYFSIQECETAFQCIERASRMRSVLMLTDGNGNLYFDRTNTGQALKTVLERGKNIIAGYKNISWQERFKNYTIKTQAKGSDDAFGKTISAMKRTAEDSGITRYRPIYIQADNEDDGSELQKRIDWERNVRAGRSLTLSYTVQGWEHEEGLWEPNKIVRVIDNRFNIDSEMLITTTTQKRDSNGTTTEIEVMSPAAFKVEPLPTKNKKEVGLKGLH